LEVEQPISKLCGSSLLQFCCFDSESGTQFWFLWSNRYYCQFSVPPKPSRSSSSWLDHYHRIRTYSAYKSTPLITPPILNPLISTPAPVCFFFFFLLESSASSSSSSSSAFYIQRVAAAMESTVVNATTTHGLTEFNSDTEWCRSSSSSHGRFRSLRRLPSSWVVQTKRQKESEFASDLQWSGGGGGGGGGGGAAPPPARQPRQQRAWEERRCEKGRSHTRRRETTQLSFTHLLLLLFTRLP
jgi:hypothetical protein